MKNPEAARLSEEQPSLKQDPRYKQLVEEASLRYLKERDATWFYKNYSGGRSANGYLLDRNGRETNFLPSQNISGGIVNIRARAKTEFMRLYPEDAKKYGEKSTAPIMQKPGGQKRVIEDELKKLLGKESTKDGGLKWIEIEEVGEAKSKLTGEAVELLKNIGDSIPAFISKNLRRILKENKIEIGPNDTPQDAINKLKERRSGLELTEQPEKPQATTATITKEGAFEPLVTIEEKNIAESEFAPMSREQKKGVFEGIANIGYFVQETKARFFKELCLLAGKTTAEGGALGRFFNEYANIHDRKVGQAKTTRESRHEGALQNTAAVGSGLATLVKYGRIFADTFGGSFLGLNPLRNVTLGSMFIGQSAEAIKEARLSYESVKEGTRVNDINRAAEEAWAVYELAKNSDEIVTKEFLGKAYSERLPADLKDRLSRMDFASYGFVQRLVYKDVLRTVDKIQNKLQEIDLTDSNAPAEKNILRGKIFNKYSLFLSDLDRIVGDAGTVDMVAYGARLTESAGKNIANVMVIETLAEGAFKIFESTDHFEAGITVGDVAIKVSPSEVLDVEKPLEASDSLPETETPVSPSRVEDENEKAEIDGQTDNILRDSSGNAVLDSSGNPVRTGQLGTVSDKTMESAPNEQTATIYKVNPGDNLWNVLKGDLPEIKELESGRQSNVIANIIEQINKDPENFGIRSGDVDKLTEGDSLDMKKIREILTDTKISVGDDEFGIIERAENLSEEQIAQIDMNDEKIAEWAAEHPGEALTSEKVSEILSGQEDSLGAGGVLDAKVSDMLKDKINDMYGWKGFFGFGSRTGLESTEWQSIKGEPAERIIDFPLTALEEYRHVGEMERYLKELSEKSGLSFDGDESVEVFVKRALREIIS